MTRIIETLREEHRNIEELLLVLEHELSAFGRDGVAQLQFLEDHVLFRMMAAIRIILKITDDPLYNFIVGPLVAVENT